MMAQWLTFVSHAKKGPGFAPGVFLSGVCMFSAWDLSGHFSFLPPPTIRGLIGDSELKVLKQLFVRLDVLNMVS